MSEKVLKNIARLFIIGAVIVVTIQAAIAQPPLPVTVQGVVTYENGSYVPNGWNVALWNLDETYSGEPWTGKTGFFLPIYNYTAVGSATASSTFKIDVQGDNYRGSETFEGSPFGFYVINVTVSPTGGVTPTPTPTPTTGGDEEGGAPAKTPSTTSIEEEKTYENITAGEEVKVELLERELEITFKNNLPGVKITAKELVEKPADVPDAPGIVFKYLEYNIENAEPEDIERVTIPFDVPKSWIASQNIEPATTKLNRYYNGVWNPLPTEKVGEDVDNIHYSAETEGLSLFAITGEKKPEAPSPATWVWIVLGVLLVIVVIAGVWYMKKRK